MIEDEDAGADQEEEGPGQHGENGIEGGRFAGFAEAAGGDESLDDVLVAGVNRQPVEQTQQRDSPEGAFGQVEVKGADVELALGGTDFEDLRESAGESRDDDCETENAPQPEDDGLNDVGPDDGFDSTGDSVEGDEDADADDHETDIPAGEQADRNRNQEENFPEADQLQENETEGAVQTGDGAVTVAQVFEGTGGISPSKKGNEDDDGQYRDEG